MIEDKKLILEYSKYLNDAQDVYRDKFEEIRDSIQAFNQIMPDASEAASTYLGNRVGNDADEQKILAFSHYVVPLHTAIAKYFQQQMLTNPRRFEIEGNTLIGHEIQKAFTRELLKIYSNENIRKEEMYGLWMSIVTGTMITQTYTSIEEEKRIIIKGGKPEIEKRKKSRTVNVMAYDPRRVIIDWNALPQRVTETAKWAIVTIGDFTEEYIKEVWGVDVKGSTPTRGYHEIDYNKYQNERESGMDRQDVFPVREFYKVDGYKYIIINDSIIAAKEPNSNGRVGILPLNFAQIWVDPDSPYGQTLWKLLQPSVEMASAAINQICDANALNNKMPFFTFDQIFPEEYISLNECNRNEIIKLNFEPIIMAGGSIDITKLITKLTFPEVSQSAQLMFQQATDMIWYLTGLNPTTLGGMQEKQIRVTDVAEMINNASLRNSSELVINIENGYMNPTTRDIFNIMEMYYDDFDLSSHGITKEHMKEIKNVRVVNGSYLPADNMTRMQKMAIVAQRAMTNPLSYEQRNVEEDLLLSNGILPDVYLKDPMKMVTDKQAEQMAMILQSYGPDYLMQYLQQASQQNKTGEGEAPQGGA